MIIAVLAWILEKKAGFLEKNQQKQREYPKLNLGGEVGSDLIEEGMFEEYPEANVSSGIEECMFFFSCQCRDLCFIDDNHGMGVDYRNPT